ncbi:hypothetical protein A7K93_04940 [Candidatus Methylacidiphilum fumarolicum]|nr:hypothetical protein A7K93_04940 [Candidatus Methylacidiphilum fumarolicum]
MGFQGSKELIFRAERILEQPLIPPSSTLSSPMALLSEAPQAGPHAEPEAPSAQDRQSSAA